MLPIRPRIEGFSYVGLHRYSLIICTSNRKHVFCDGEIVARVLAMIRQCAVANEFAILAYCFMPDHVLRDDEETGRAVKYVLENPVRAKLATGFADYRFSGSDVFSTEELRGFW